MDKKCHDCGAEDWPDYALDNLLWNELSPTKSSRGLLCLNCLARRFQNNYGVAAAIGPSLPLVIYVAGISFKDVCHDPDREET